MAPESEVAATPHEPKPLLRHWSILVCACVLVAPPGLAQDASRANWFETQIAIEELAEAGDYVGALALGDNLLEQIEMEFGEGDQHLADARLLLARIQSESGDYSAAEQEILAAIDIYEADVGRLSPELIPPFLQLGDNYESAGDYAAAMSAWGEARTIGRRNFGLLNTQQLPILDQMTEAAEELEQIETARDLQQEALVLVERIYGPSSRESMEARFKYAGWLRQEDAFFSEQLRIYFEIERTIEDHFDRDPLLIARVMHERALAFRNIRNGDPLGISGLRDALELVEEMPEPPPLVMASLLVDIGDWYVAFSRSSGEEYRLAWQLLGQLDNSEELRRAWFADLIEIDRVPMSRRHLSDDPEDPAGHILIGFTVDTSGHTRDVEIIESNPADLKDTAALTSFREARYRPSIVDGELVPAERKYRLDFRYRPPEED